MNRSPRASCSSDQLPSGKRSTVTLLSSRPILAEFKNCQKPLMDYFNALFTQCQIPSSGLRPPCTLSLCRRCRSGKHQHKVWNILRVYSYCKQTHITAKFQQSNWDLLLAARPTFRQRPSSRQKQKGIWFWNLFGCCGFRSQKPNELVLHGFQILSH